MLRRIEPPRRVRIVANPAAGGDTPIGALESALQGAGFAWDVSVTSGPGDAERFAREAAESGVDVVAAYGGDGTVVEVVAGLEGTEVPLAILPGGTANVFALEVGVPTDLGEAVALLAGPACVKAADAGVLGEERFLVRVGVGLEAYAVADATRERKDRFGVMAYVLGALRSAMDAPVVRYRLRVDGEEATAEGVTCVIANAGSLGRLGLRLAPDISVEDGLLDVLVLRSAEIAATLRAAATVVAGETPPEDVAARWKAREVTVDVEPGPQRAVRDGEDAGETPLHAAVLPGAVQVVVPCP